MSKLTKLVSGSGRSRASVGHSFLDTINKWGFGSLSIQLDADKLHCVPKC